MAKHNRKPSWLIESLLRDAAKGNSTTQQLSDRYDVSRYSVRKWCLDAGVTPKRGNVSNTTPDEVWEKVIPHMGKMGDKSVSALFNGKPSASSIRAKRMKLGIESFQKSPERKDPNDYRFVPNETEKLMQTWKNTNQFRHFMSELCYNNYSQLVAQFLTPDTSGVAGGHSGPECDRALSFLNEHH